MSPELPAAQRSLVVNILERIRSMVSKPHHLHEETRYLIAGVSNVNDLRKGLDEIITANELDLKEIRAAHAKMVVDEEVYKARIRLQNLEKRAKGKVLAQLKRLGVRQRYNQRLDRICQDNIDLHLELLNKIDELESMDMKLVEQNQIEEIAINYEELVERHREMVIVSQAADTKTKIKDGDRSLEQIEQEILGRKDSKRVAKEAPE